MTRQSKVLLITSVGVFLSFLDATIVNIAFPSIQRSFPGDSLSSLSWILNAYNIVWAALLVPAGRLGDVFGRRRMFLAGLALFLASSALCGVAPSVGFLIAARVPQAIGAALLVPNALGLLLTEMPPEKRALVTAFTGATAALAAAAGPTLGSLLISAESWRWVFYVNLPVGLGALVAGTRVLVERRGPAPATLPDALGVGLIVGAVGLVSLGIIEGPAANWGWTDARVIGAVLAGLVLLAAFVRRSERYHDPVFDLDLFRVRSFATANAATFIFALGFYAALLTGVEFLANVWGWSVIETGFGVAPTPVVAAVASVISGNLVDRLGHRPIAIAGAFLYASGSLLLALRTGDAPHYVTVYLPSAILLGLGIGMTIAPITAAALAELPPARFSTGSAVNTAIRQVGAVLGVSILVAVLGGATLADALRHFHTAWILIAGIAALTAVPLLLMGHVTVRDPGAPPAAGPLSESEVGATV
jgi:EmrB/QacA subfamily drug resistance transporter